MSTKSPALRVNTIPRALAAAGAFGICLVAVAVWGQTPAGDKVGTLKLVVDGDKRYDGERVKKAFDATRNYAGMIGNISFSPENHCALDAEQVVLVSVASVRDPRSLGVFRERA